MGITTVTKQYPWISRVLTALIQKSDPKHRFTSVGISCNASTEPHRDVYNSEQYQNLIVPLVYPKTGGHLWVAKAPHAQQSGLSRQCGKHEVSGALVALKPALYLDPHCWHATSEWTGDRMLAVGYCLKASNKLGAEERDSLKALGFRIPLASQVTFSSALQTTSVPSCEVTELRRELDSAACLLSSQLPTAAQHVAEACATAFQQAEAASWEVYQDSMLSYSQPRTGHLDLLEVYVKADSRLTDQIISQGGQALRFTAADGDLTTAEGQRKLWDLLQLTQPRHVWMSPDSRYWCSWTNLNSARNPQGAQTLKQHRQRELVHLRLCAKVCEWQKQKNRHFHFEQPVASRMLSEPDFKPILQSTQRITVDMSAFGFCTPIHQVPIRKRAVIFSTSSLLIQSLVQEQCPRPVRCDPLSSKQHELRGFSNLSSTYCTEFAKHVAVLLLKGREETALASEGSPPMTRKRFKTSLGLAQPRSKMYAQKRASEPDLEGEPQSKAPRRIDLPTLASVQSPESLPTLQWQPVFASAAQHACKVTPSLVPKPHSPLLELLQEQLPNVRILQVFVGKGCKQLHSPLGALPATVAPWRINLCMRQPAGQATLYQYLGKEDRTTLPAEGKRARIPSADILITIFAQHKNPEDRLPSPGSEPGPPERAAEPTLEGWAPPPVPIHGPAFRNLDKDLKTKLIRAHNNLGHPDPRKLSEHLRAAGESKQLVEAALDYQCDVCLESTVPRHQRPGKLPEPKEFNDVIGVDGFFFKSQAGYRAYVLHFIDESSCFHLGRRSSSRLGAEAINTLRDGWSL